LISEPDLQSHESYGHDPYDTHAKGQGQKSLGSKFKVKTDRWRDRQMNG